jgi:hypothetical protein
MLDDPGRVARWRKALWVVAAVVLHGAAGKAILALRFAWASSLAPRGDRGVRVRVGAPPRLRNRQPWWVSELDEAVRLGVN